MTTAYKTDYELSALYDDVLYAGLATESELAHHHDHHAYAGHASTCAFCAQDDRYRIGC